MPYDGIMINAVVDELQTLIGQRVDKIYQPEEDEVQLQFRMKDKRRLKFSINASMPYMTMSQIRKGNPTTPPNFLILLRKHLQGSILKGITQLGNDRIVTLVFNGRNELGDPTVFSLVYELMGKHSNLILLDEKLMIIDSLKRVPPYMSQVRQILPNMTYINLPTDQVNLSEISYDVFENVLRSTDLPIRKVLYQKLQGLSPAISNEILSRLDIDKAIESQVLDSESVSKLFLNLKNLNSEDYYIFKDEEGFYKDFHIIKLEKFPIFETRTDVCTLIDDFYAGKDLQLRVKQHSSDLRKLIDNRIKRSHSKLQSLDMEMQNAMGADIYKLKGELILANLYQMEKGMTSIEVINYYDEQPITVELDKNLSPQDNSQAYYKKYNKLKSARDHLTDQLEHAKQEIDYLESILSSIANSLELENLAMIKEELVQQGYVKKKGYRKEKKLISKPHHYVSKTGFDIYVGKNNVQNDQLTFKAASNSDIWLHTKDIPGSHVIISAKGQPIDEATLLLAAKLSAFFSKSKFSSKVPVDYTEVRHVKKPSGAKPGFVNYFHQQTLYVTPDESEVNQYKK
jgi:predicted ribosome quality control (RQC) complex YloA/Tae2 family protein